MKIYHGSKLVIENIKPHGSNPKNDYGPSFYMTTDIESAKSWACKNSSLGVVNEYRISDKAFSNLKILDLTDKNTYSVLNWIAILLHFRELDSSFVRQYKSVIEWIKKYYIDVSQYDVVIGYRADDSYFRFPMRFITNELSLEDLEEVFKLGHLGVQYAFMSNRAIRLLKFEGIIECEDKFLGHYYSIVTRASKEFDEILNKPIDIHKTYVLDLMRKEDEH